MKAHTRRRKASRVKGKRIRVNEARRLALQQAQSKFDFSVAEMQELFKRHALEEMFAQQAREFEEQCAFGRRQKLGVSSQSV